MISFKKISVSGFSCFKNQTELQLENIGLVLITGTNMDTTSCENNGAGKTTIMKAITWGLFGNFVDGDKGMEVIHKDAKSAVVEILFYDDELKRTYKTIRKQSKSSQKLELLLKTEDSEEFSPIKGATKNITQQKVNKILGLDYKTWVNTVFFSKGLSGRFADRGIDDKERKNIIKKIFNLEVIDCSKKIAAEKLQKLNTEKLLRQEEINKLKIEVKCLDITMLRSKKEAWETQKLRKIKMYEDSIKKTEDKMREQKLRPEDIEKFNAECTKYKDTIKEQDDLITQAKGILIEDLDGMKVELNKQERAVSEINREIIGINAHKKQIGKQLRLLEGNKCSICTSDLNGGKALEHKDGLKIELMGLGDKIEKLDNEKATYEKEIKAQKYIIEEQEDFTNEVRRLRKSNEFLKGKVEQLKSREESFKLVLQAHERNIRSLRNNITNLENEENPFVDMLQKAVAKFKRLSNKIQEFDSGLEELEKDIVHYDFWNKAFSDQGIVSFVIDSILPNLNKLVNEKLQTLSDGDITVVYDSESTLKSGGVRDKISLNTTIEGLENVTPSGAQTEKINLATALALMDLVASRQDKRIDLQMLDEPFDSLDKVGKQRAVDILKKQIQTKGTILVTSHDADIFNSFTSRILVERKNGESRIKG